MNDRKGKPVDPADESEPTPGVVLRPLEPDDGNSSAIAEWLWANPPSAQQPEGDFPPQPDQPFPAPEPAAKKLLSRSAAAVTKWRAARATAALASAERSADVAPTEELVDTELANARDIRPALAEAGAATSDKTSATAKGAHPPAAEMEATAPSAPRVTGGSSDPQHSSADGNSQDAPASTRRALAGVLLAAAASFVVWQLATGGWFDDADEVGLSASTKIFDPSKYGNKPFDPSQYGTFDPSQYGDIKPAEPAEKPAANEDGKAAAGSTVKVLAVKQKAPSSRTVRPQRPRVRQVGPTSAPVPVTVPSKPPAVVAAPPPPAPPPTSAPPPQTTVSLTAQRAAWVAAALQALAQLRGQYPTGSPEAQLLDQKVAELRQAYGDPYPPSTTS